MDASRGMYMDVETVEFSDVEASEAGIAQRRRASRAAGAAAVLLGVGVAAALTRASAPVRRPQVADSDAAVGLDQVSDLKPIELMHDGNVCDMNEELYGGLCYKQCKLLTKGLAHIRTSPWSCCESSPCTFNKEHAGAPLPCHGYDVSGSGGCPHKPGACLLDEELHLGQCYKKCSDLTNGEFPYRTAPASCCKTKGLGCLYFKNLITDGRFDVGGGAGDGDASTPADVHFPLKSLTEDSNMAVADSAKGSADERPVAQGSLRPLENTHDGNPCDDREELHDGLCYKKCSLLTEGVAPIRTSAWTCCEGHPCGLRNQHGEIGPSIMCNGFDVSADGKCPHKPGACLIDEEMFLGVCFKKCSLLTDGAYPHRVAAASCCKSKSGFGCLNPFNDRTSPSFDVGGGSTPEEAEAHAPEESLTENEGMQTKPATTAAPPAATREQNLKFPMTFGVASAESMKEFMKKRM